MTLLQRIARKIITPFWLITRGMTLGVRAIVVDDDDRVLLVRHTYIAGWYLPGGGVDVGEAMADAVGRELLEEVNVELMAAPEMVGFYFNAKTSKRDHVGLFLCREWRQRGDRRPNLEIAESGFFAIDALPEETTAGTRARLKEVLQDGETSLHWS